MSDIQGRVRQYQKAHRRNWLHGLVVVCLVLTVVAVTTVSQFLTAYTQTKETYCGLDHEHSIECYANPDADVESQREWEDSLPNLSDCETEVDRLLVIARSQLGYHESTRNYEVDGDVLYGYTRYGAWLDAPYTPWNEAFALFCLHYAGMDEGQIPLSSEAWDWVDLLIEASEPYDDGSLPEQLFYAAGDAGYEPRPGDLVFYEDDDAAVRVGILDTATKHEGKGAAYTTLKIIAGDEQDAVRQVELRDDSEDLVGFGAIPAELREAPKDEDEPEDEPLEDEEQAEAETQAAQSAELGSGAEGEKDTSSDSEGAPDQDEHADAAEQGEGGRASSAGNRVEIELGQDDDKPAKEDATASGERDDDATSSDAGAAGKQGEKAGQTEAKGGKDKGGENADDAEQDGDAKQDASSDKDAQLEGSGEATGLGQDDTSNQGNASLVQTEPGVVVAAQTLSTEANGYRITVDLVGATQDNLTLRVMPLDPTRAQLKAVERSLSQELEDGATKQAHVAKRDVRAFDICVVDETGNEVNLDATARVRVAATVGAGPVMQATAPEVVHLSEGGPEHLEAEANASGFAFETGGFSPFVFVYTVDFEYQGYAWSMPGGSSVLLSTVLGNLDASIDVADVTDVTFSDPSLIEVMPSEGNTHDWLLTSLAPFKTHETLALTLADGSIAVIDVTDEDETVQDILDQSHWNTNPNIRRLLDRVQFFDGDILVGDSQQPDSMVVRPGHEYTMRVEFSEDENKDHESGQLPDDGVMYYGIPEGVILAAKAFNNVDGKLQIPFSIVLDRKHTLENNTVTYVPKNESATGQAYLMIEWNKSDAANYKLLKASPRTTFMLSFPYTTIEVEDESDIAFSDSAILSVNPDPSFDVELQKTAKPSDSNKEIIEYEVTAVADGNVENVLFTDVMGEALTYLEGNTGLGSGLTITYRHKVGEDAEGNPTYADYATLPEAYGDANKEAFHVAEGNHGFDFKLRELKSSDMAVFSYSARVDYTKLGGKNNIDVTSRNTVSARDSQDNLLAEASQALDKDIDYLQLGKASTSIVYVDEQGREITSNGPTEGFAEGESTVLGSHYVADHWKYMYVHWKVIYNPDHQINVEGATLKDTVWMGKKYSTTYATDRGFTVTAYSNGSFTKDNGSVGDSFTPAGDAIVTPIITPTAENGYGWDDLERGDVDVTVADSGSQQLSSWEWTIPQKTVTGVAAETPQVYVVEYWTKIDRDGADTGGYVGNQVTESIADITRDKSVELPGVGSGWDVSVDKQHIVDDYSSTDGKVYSQWEITFNRRDFDLERALVEDTLPHLRVTRGGKDYIYRDVFVRGEKSDTNTHGWEVEGLFDTDTKKEQCVPSVSADGYDVVFWFFKNKNKIEHPDITTPGQGLYSGLDAPNEQKKITIRFWTENDNDWIKDAAQGLAANEHWNHVHLVLNGKEAVDKAYAVPKPVPSIKKSVEQAGTWTDGNITLPVYRYTLSLNGMSDDAFKQVTGQDHEYELVVSDEFSALLDYLPISDLPLATDNTNKTKDLGNGTSVTLNSRAASDEVLIRPVPMTDTSWPATFTGPATTSSEGDGKEQLTITIPLTEEQREAMKYQVKAEDGSDFTSPDPDNPSIQRPVKVYGGSYDISYYLAPDFTKVKNRAQQMVDTHEHADTKLNFSNTARWQNGDGQAGESSFTASTDYNMNPVQKQLVSYNDESELATYSIDVNPLRLTMNGGKRYAVEDSYANLAVDFQTVKFKTYPAGRENEIEWSYHNNKGTFWVPDETRVTITYEGWPVGKHGANGLTFSNTASIGEYNDPKSKNIKLKVDHEGYASTYHVRIFKFENDDMATPLEGAVFQLFERDASGAIVPMTYGLSHGVSDGNNEFNHWNAEDDERWTRVNEERATEAEILNSHGFVPTPERHYAGDSIYFITGMHGEDDDYKSEQKGFADVMLSQSRDGVSLKKNKQYYLLEVMVPEGHTKEDILWRFIIGDDDDWSNYVYSDDSILQVSNASLDRVLTVRKTFVDRTAEQRITYNDVQKNLKFQVVGTSLEEPHNVIYNKIVSYADFKNVSVDGTKSEWMLIIRSLSPGNYRVTELRNSAFSNENGIAPDSSTDLATFVEGDAVVKHVNDKGEPIAPDTTAEAEFSVMPNGSTSTGDAYFTFTVPATDKIVEGELEHTETSVKAEFTNIYTDEDPVSVTVSKQWDSGGKEDFTPIKAEFALYADGEKYDLTKHDGGNENGNIELVVEAGAVSPWATAKTVNNLPRKKLVKTAEGGNETTALVDIAWTVKEVSATYHTGDASHPNTTVTGMYLEDHFKTEPDAEQTVTTTGDQSAEVSFSNRFNNLTSVTVKKSWADDETVNHEKDVVYFDLYRTTTNIGNYTEEQLRSLAENTSQCQHLNLPEEDSKLSYSSDPEASFTYANELLEKMDNDGKSYYYFAIERSVAGYEDSYSRAFVYETPAGGEVGGQPSGQDEQDAIGQTIEISNARIAGEPRGTLTIQKQIAGTDVPDNLDKTYEFTLWNSGKYLVYNEATAEPTDVKLVPENEASQDQRTFAVKLDQTLTLTDVELGTYDLVEVRDAAQIGGYKLTSTTLSVNGGTDTSMGEGLKAGVDLKQNEGGNSQGIQANVVVTNTYEKDTSNDAKTDYTFGKLWVMPDTDNTTTLPWPDNMSITMQLGRRIKGTTTEDATFDETCTFVKGTGSAITATIGPDAYELDIHNPDASEEASGGTSGNTSGEQDSMPGGESGEGNTDGTGYHHYTFTVKGLDKYDANGNEWEYFAKETGVTERKADAADPNQVTQVNVQDPANSTGRYFTAQYGVVDGIGARVLADDEADTSVGVNGNVGYAINRLEFTQRIEIPIKKLIDGRFDLHDNAVAAATSQAGGGTQGGDTSGATNDFPPFTFGLYDALGHAVTSEQGGVSAPATATTDGSGRALFDITRLVDLNDMMWWSDEHVLTGRYNFWVKEERPYVGQLAPLAYNGITFTGDSVKVSFYVRYDWQTGTFTYLKSGAATSTAKPDMDEAILVNKYDPGTVKLTVHKKWDDDNNRDGYRKPAKFKVTAYYYTDDGVQTPLDKVWLLKEGKNAAEKDEIDLSTYRIEVGTSDDSTKTVTLPRLYEGHVIYYQVDEVLDETYIAGEDTASDTSDDVTLDNKYAKRQAIAKIGSTYYPSLSAAVAAAQTGDTVELVADDDVSFATGGIILDKSLTINGHGHAVTGQNEYPGFNNVGSMNSLTDDKAHGFYIKFGDVTIKNLTMTQFGDTNACNKFGLVPVLTASEYNGTLTLEKLSIDKFNRQAICINNGAFTIKDCAINGNAAGTGVQGQEYFQQCIEIRGGSGTISNTTVKSTTVDNVADYDQVGIVSWSQGDVTLNNVDVDVAGIGVEPDGCTLTIKGDKTYVRGTKKALFVEDDGTLKVQAGTYVGDVATDTGTSTIAVSGGEFSQPVLAGHCADGYIPSDQLADGMWSVTQLKKATVPMAATGLVYNGTAQVGVAPGEGYTVQGGTKTNAGSYQATVTLGSGYTWSDGTTGAKTVDWSIAKAEIAVPTPVSGLVYNGTEQAGVPAGEGYGVQGGSARSAGDYTATVTPDANHRFADDATSQTLAWTIGRAPATVKANDTVKVAGKDDPSFAATVTGTFGNDTLAYTCERTGGEDEVSYVITPSGSAVQGNYQVTYETGTLTIMGAAFGDDAVAYTMSSDGTVTAHTTLAAAVSAASADNGYTVHLIKDVPLSSTLTIKNQVIIDGSKGALSHYAIQAADDATTVNPLINVKAAGDLTLSNVTIDAEGKGRAIKVQSGKLTLNDGATVTGGATESSFIGGVYMTGASELTMNGGTITGNSVSNQYANDHYLQYSADVWIGAEAKGTMNAGTVDNLFVNSNEYAKPPAGFTLNGGTITNAFIEYDRKNMASLTYNGGALSNLYIAEDDAHEHNDTHNATQTVSSPQTGTTYNAASAVARVGSTYYASFEDAVRAAQLGETVTMLADITLNSMVTLSENLTIDLNGHTLSGNTDTDKLFQVQNNATLTINGSTDGSTVVGRINVGTATENNGNLVLNGGTYRCGNGQTVVHVNGKCTDSSVTIKNATVTSPSDNGIQLNGAGKHSIVNSTISGATAVYLKAGTLEVTDSTLTSTATGHTAYQYNPNGSVATGDAIVVDSCAYPGGNPKLILGEGNTVSVAANSGNVQVGYYEYNTEQTGYKPGDVTSTMADDTLPAGYAWAGEDGEYYVDKAWTVSFDPNGGVVSKSGTDNQTEYKSQKVVDNWYAKKPVNPTRLGKIFLGWYYTDPNEGEKEFDFNTPITKSMTLTAKWEDITAEPVPNPHYTNKHVPETIDVSIEKKWDDEDSASTRGPVTMKLFAEYTVDGQTIRISRESIATEPTSPWYPYLEKFVDVELTADGSWKDITSWADLPRYAPGQSGAIVNYKIEESAESLPLGYYQVTDDSDTDIKVNKTAEKDATAENVIKNRGEWVNIPLKKVWQDDSDRDGLRKELTSVTMILSAATTDGAVTIDQNFKNKAGTAVSATQHVTGSSTQNEWTGPGWTGLPKYYHGKEIIYTVTESPVPVLENYTASNDGKATPITGDSSGTRSVTNTHAVDRTQMELEKIWRDNTNQDGKRPDVATYVKNFVRLYAAAGSETTCLVIGDSPITGTTDEYYLYIMETDGTPMQQYVVEGEQQKPKAVLSGNHQHGADDYDYVVRFKNLPSLAAHGVSITYTVKETDLEGHELGSVSSGSQYTNLTGTVGQKNYGMYEFVSSDYDSDLKKYTITNQYEPDVIHIKAIKNWVPQTGTNLTEAEIETLSSQVRFKLVATEDGNPIDMTEWNSGLHYPYDVTPEQRLSKETTATGTVWYAEWDGLPKHDPAGVEREIVYTVEEIQCPDYYRLTTLEPSRTVEAKSYSDQTTVPVTIENKYEDVSVNASKNWSDENNQDDLRQGVIFQLQEKIGENGTFQDVSGKTYVVNALGPADATWSNLPAWKNNQRVYYRVVEVTSNGQTALVDNYSVKDGKTTGTFVNPKDPTQGTSTYNVSDVIINTHIPLKRTATFTKQWDHKGASDYLTPDQYLEKLHLYARAKGQASSPVEVSVSGDSWTPALFLEENKTRNNDWKAATHTTVTSNNDGTVYTVTVNGLPKYMPKSVESSGATELEYFITEGAITNYTRIHPVTGGGSTLPEGMIGESVGQNAATEYLKNERDTGSLQIRKSVVSNLAADEDQVFNFTITSNPKVTGTGYAVSGSGSTSGSTLDFDSYGVATVSITGSKEVTIAGLPVGVDYTVSENLTQAQQEDFDKTCAVSSEGSVNDGAGTVQTHKGNESSPDSVTFTNTRKKSNLTISKSIVSAVQTDTTREYKFEVKLFGLKDENQTYSDITFTKVTGENYHRGEVTLTQSDRKKNLVDLPTDATYEITEIENNTGESYLGKFDTTWTKTVGTGNPSEPVAGRVFPGDQTGINTVTTSDAEVAFTNKRMVSSLTLSKELTNAIPTDNGDVFYFDVELLGDDTQSLILDGSAPVVKVGNTDMPGSQESGPYYDASTHTIMKVPVTYSFANHQGSTVITNLPLGTTYTITEHASDDIITRTNKANITPAGNQMDTVTTGGNTTTFTNTRKTGTLSINKQVVSPIAAEKDSNHSYTVEITLMTKHGIDDTTGHKAPVSITAQLRRGSESATAENLTFNNSGKAQVQIHHDETVYISGIPTDVTYTIDEVNIQTQNINGTNVELFSDTYTNESGEIAANSTAASTVTNTRKLGNLTVSKAVVSPVASDESRQYKFTVTMGGPNGYTLENGTYGSMTFSNNAAEFTLTGANTGNDITAAGLPIGWTYSVAESQADGTEGISLDKFDTTWIKTGAVSTSTSIAGAQFPGSNTQVDINTVTDTASTVAFTNTRKTGTLRLVKQVHSPFPRETGAASDGYDKYYFKVALQMPTSTYNGEKISGDFPATNVDDNKVTFSAGGVAIVPVRGSAGETDNENHYVEISGLPIDVEYTVEEVNSSTDASAFADPAFETPGHVYKGKVEGTSSGEIGSGITSGSTPTYTIKEEGSIYAVEVTNKRKVVPVSLYKVSSVFDNTYLAGAEFTMNKMLDATSDTIDDNWTARILISDADGRLVWQNPSAGADDKKFDLEPGTYQLIETKAPIGYNKLAKPVTFTVTADGVNYKDQIREYVDTYGNLKHIDDGANKELRVVNIFVANSTGAELPSTGGAGPVSVYAGGALALMLAGIVVYLQTRKP